MHNTLLETIQNEWIAQFREESLSNPLNNRLVLSNFDGISVYMESHHATLFNHLKSTFPLCMRLVGDAFWYALLHRYINHYESTQYDINQYGDSLPQFIANFEPAKELPYLHELCSIEWHWHTLKLASPAKSFDFESFACIDEMSFQSLCFHLTPNLKILDSQYPIYQIWAMNYFQQDKQIQISGSPEKVVIYQHNDLPCIMLISKEEYLFLEHLSSGNQRPWQKVVTELSKWINEEKIGDILTKALRYQWINHFSLEAI
ncbi:TPA: putative DNA-binding domain-containing protein [Legionella pneumophila]|uniref:HvfC/BufC family peptide modification chaperone n=1 Tax=Legionella pneumophila TaxID=446 RepID=UPI0004913149|nr:putative DNA-binding domain-containing protein [Legionella pneumophila]MDW9166552.1 putative DNA-binding domain-containing protein [Legionella pneumophila subsp. fraseri]MDX1845382.1 putative DNA-binding domain-containing protein [Legionella pneumophila subsp. fraseri]RYB34646.1 DUF2063 domain-containing protein [Legionella pneumophila]RYW23804.1 DUF2063 domain-containing protein [Legionella pneumophila]HAT1771357.1 DUF2063 domain-containing protein [Legionella pneumophila]